MVFFFQYLFFPYFSSIFSIIFHFFFDFFDLIFLKYQWKNLPTLFGKKLTFCIIRPRVSEVKKVVEVHCWSGLSWQMVSNKVEVDSSGLSRDSCESAYSICNKNQKIEKRRLFRLFSNTVTIGSTRTWGGSNFWSWPLKLLCGV